MRGRIGWLGVIAGAFVSASAPVTISIDGGVKPQTAECQSGTCCPEDKSTCVIGGHQIGGYYHKPEGSCTNDT